MQGDVYIDTMVVWDGCWEKMKNKGAGEKWEGRRRKLLEIQSFCEKRLHILSIDKSYTLYIIVVFDPVSIFD